MKKDYRKVMNKSHPYNPWYKNKGKNKGKSEPDVHRAQENDRQKGVKNCFNCGKEGHVAKHCLSKKNKIDNLQGSY
jgi:hypothetical protein